MQRLTHFCGCVSLLLLLLAGAGCGGGSSAPSTRFAGTYSGSLLQGATSYVTSAANLTIDGNGNVKGTTANGVGKGRATLTGTVSSAGTATLNVVNSDSTHDTVTGTFALEAPGYLVGSLKNAAGSPVTLTVTNSGQTFIFLGRYFGNVTTSGSNSSGTVSLFISPTGPLTGTLTNGNVTTTLTGTISHVGVTTLTATTASGTDTSSGGAAFDSNGNLVFELVDSSDVTTILTLSRQDYDPP